MGPPGRHLEQPKSSVFMWHTSKQNRFPCEGARRGQIPSWRGSLLAGKITARRG